MISLREMFWGSTGANRILLGFACLGSTGVGEIKLLVFEVVLIMTIGLKVIRGDSEGEGCRSSLLDYSACISGLIVRE